MFAVVTPDAAGDGTVLLDMGGPGLGIEGLLEALDAPDVQRAVGDRSVVLLGQQAWSQEERCLRALDEHVASTLGRAPSPVGGVRSSCGLATAGERLHAGWLEAIETVMAGIPGQYAVLGSSYAAARWERLVADLPAAHRPSDLTIVSPLSTRSEAVLPHQVKSATTFWSSQLRSRCPSCSLEELAGRDLEVAAGLLMTAATPRETAQLLHSVDVSPSGYAALRTELRVAGKSYLQLNAADYPRRSLAEYLGGVCPLVGDEVRGGFSNPIEELVYRFHAVCADVPQAGALPPPKASCYAVIDDDPAVPEVDGSRTVTATTTESPTHGDLAVLASAAASECQSGLVSTSTRYSAVEDPVLDSLVAALSRHSLPVVLPVVRGTAGRTGGVVFGDVSVQIGGDLLPMQPSGQRLDGYCLMGSVPASEPATPALGTYVFGVGLAGSPVPDCERLEDASRRRMTLDIHGRIEISEALQCPRCPTLGSLVEAISVNGERRPAQPS